MAHQHYVDPRIDRRRSLNKKILGFGCLPIGALLILVIVLAAVGSNSDSNEPALTNKQRASIDSAAGLPPKPDAKTRTAYIGDLNAIDPDIVHGKDDKAISRGRDQCSSIKDGNSRQKLIALTNYRFTSPNHPEGHGTETASKILDVVHKRLCPGF